jgi:hypothetical protein
MNQTNTTINGPLIISESCQLNGGVSLTTTTQLNSNLLQSGSSIISQDITGTYSGTNQFKNTNFVGNVALTTGSSYIEFPGGSTDRQTKAFNNLNAGYSLSGNTLTFPTNTVINCAVGGIGNEIKCHKFNCDNIIEFPDLSIQNTAYTHALNTKLNAIDNTKLQAIGTIVSGVMSATTTLTTGVGFNAAYLDLTVGTWIISVNSCIAVITGTTTVGSILAGYSTSPTALSQSYNLAINHLNGATSSASTQWILATSNPVVVTTDTRYYMLTSCNFGTASRIQFVSSNSDFKAIRIA